MPEGCWQGNVYLYWGTIYYLLISTLYFPSPTRPDILKTESLLPKLDAALSGVGLPGCPKGPPSPGRSRRGKTRHRKASAKGSCGDLPGLRATLPPHEPGGLGGPGGLGVGPSAWDACPPALRGLHHDLLLRKMSSSSPDLLSAALGARGRGATGGARDPGSPPPPQGDTPPSEGSAPGSTSPDSPGGAKGEPPPPVGPGEGVGLLGTGREGTAGRGGSRAGSQHLTPAALLYRAAVTRSQVKYGEVPLSFAPFLNLPSSPPHYVPFPNS